MPAKSPEARRHRQDRQNERRREQRAGTFVPQPPRGPSKKPHYIPEGHELGGVSRLTNEAGETSAEWSKTRVAGADEPPVATPPDFLLKRSSEMRRGDGSVVVQWASYEPAAVARWEATREAIREHVAEYVRAAEPLAAPAVTDDDRTTLYPIGDPHVGMLAWAPEVGESHDLRIGERDLCACMRELVHRAPPTRTAIVTNLGDFFHAETNKQQTPKSGFKLDVDGRSGKVGRVGLAVFRTVIDAALEKHDHVTVRSVPGNHDPETCFWLYHCLSAVYEREPRVRIEECFNPYQYDVFGANLFGWCHGDGAKFLALGEIMAADVPALWGAARFRYWHCGHVHHEQVKELRGCVVETHRTLAGADAWHHHQGYRSGRSLRAITYHKEYGLDSVAVVGIDRVRHAIEKAKKEVAQASK